jgi:hypothetical protein
MRSAIIQKCEYMDLPFITVKEELQDKKGKQN